MYPTEVVLCPFGGYLTFIVKCFFSQYIFVSLVRIIFPNCQEILSAMKWCHIVFDIVWEKQGVERGVVKLKSAVIFLSINYRCLGYPNENNSYEIMF